MFFTLIYSCLLVVLFSLAETNYASAQGTDASISGQIADENQEGLPNATVTVTNLSTGFSTGTVTNLQGNYRLQQLPVGGPYTITATFVGYADQKKTGVMLNQGDNVEVDFDLSESATELTEVVVSGSGFKSRNDRLAAATSVSAQDVKSLPANDRNFSNLAALSPLVGGGTDIAGMSSRSNSIQIDGVNAREASFGGQGDSPYVLSMEALREFEVVTNSYDVIDGRGSAGGIKAVTKSGTNEFHGSAFAYFWDARLAADQDLQGRDVLGDTKVQRGFSLGGPIIKDKLHFFVAYDGERFEQQYDLWSQTTEEGILQNNQGGRISVTDMERALQTLRTPRYGVGDGQQYGFFQRTRTLDTWFARLDWQLNPRNTLTLRLTTNNYELPDQNNSDIGRYGLFAATYDFVNRGSNALLALRSQLSPTTSNEFKVGYFHNKRGNIITTGRHPQLWILSESVLPTGDTSEYIMVPRYNRWTPEDQTNHTYNIINNTYLTRGKYNFTFGTNNLITNSRGIYTHDTQGRFDFYSLDALERGEPDRYQRKFTNPGQELIDPVSTWMVDLSLYGQVSTELVPNLQVSAGLRYDLNMFLTKADYNEVLDQELGYRNDVAPTDFNNIQPRLNMNWDLNGDGRDIINVGAGWFAGQVITRPYIYSLIDNGIRFTGVDVSRGDVDENGNEIILPTPNYEQYNQNYEEIPGDGLTQGELYPSGGSAAQVVRFLDEDFEVPMSFRANVSYHRYLNERIRVGASLYYSKTKDMYVMENANLSDEVQFTIQGEGGREVYTPLADYSLENQGNSNFRSARISDQFEDALMFTNGYETRFMALVLDLAVDLSNDGKLNLSYTRADSRGAERFRNEDDQRFTGVSYYDYDFINSAYSPNDFRHKVLLNLTTPKIGGTQLGIFLNMIQGGRFSATTRPADLNGSKVRELNGFAAYIFDPYDPQTAALQGEEFAQDLQFVFENASPEAQEYLKENVGTYAQPYGGLKPWRTDLNVRLTQDIPVHKNHNLTFNIDVFNFLNLVDPSWGGTHNIINEELYNVEGFDPATQQVQYSVRTNYGQRRYEGNGFQLMMGLKYSF
uniref:Carboxypeptidase regulatory-like domain-containing protein n=1 Tax=Roseihalotalea indica TaxID=2867963 RepID=A0AA49JCZ0_9BACT|nr:carboxypeptidase regulatory-like domain-containing protein [Tunicatimonas sp. TK19036]